MDILPCQRNPSQSVIEEEPQAQLYKKVNEDEYPIIWYEPDIDSEEKEAFKSLIQENTEINLFSQFEEAFKAAQSLGSFLLITPSEVDEEKMFQNFEGLEDTHCRRYLDFEEKAVLVGLFKEISEDRIKSLKVYLFCTREDFLNEAPVNEEEEEVMIMCDVKEMAKQFREEFTIIWCDPNFSPEREGTFAKQLDIEEKNIYAKFEDLLKKLDDNYGPPYHLILSGKTQAELIINRIDDFKGLLCLYIYENPPFVVSGKKARKIEIEKTLEGLIPKIIQGIRTKSVYKNTFPAFATQFDDWDKSHINKVHYYLRGFVNFNNRTQAKRDFFSLAKKIYQSQKLFDFEKEYFEYRKEQILRWYAEESPIYKLINNCLRISTSDSILHCRFILKDMEKAIKEEYQKERNRFNGVVYRGAFISNTEFEKLERNIGKEIEMYGFLSTSKNLKTAQKFLNDDIANKVLITIIIPSLPRPDIDEQGFAEMNKFSKFPQEEEILFNVRSRFQVLEVGSVNFGQNNQECRHLVLLYGPQLLRQSLTIEKPTVDFILELPSELECNYCKSKYNLLTFQEGTGKTQVICRKCFTLSNFVSKSTFLFPVDKRFELSGENRINLQVQGRMMELGIEAKLAYAKTYKCYQCSKFGESFCKSINLEDGSIKLDCLECFQKKSESQFNHLLLFEGSTQAFWTSNLGKWEGVEMDWKAGEFKELETDEGADIFDKAHDYTRCQRFCRTFLRNLVRKIGRERVKMMSYWKIGNSSEKLGEYQRALEYHLQGLEIRKSIYGESHPETATSYNNLASVYESLGEYQIALEYHLKGLEIRESIYGESHPDTATSNNNIASVYHSLGEYQRAFEYHLKVLEIRESIYGNSHPNTATSYNNIASVYANMREYQKALEYFLKALKIYKSIYGESHPHTATSYCNLAFVYYSLGEYQIALEYHLKGLEIRESIYGESHPDIATSNNNLASVYERLGEYQKALEYHLKALKIQKSIYGESHPHTATSYNNLALVYNSLREYQKALEYILKALEIQKSIYRDPHPHTASSYNNLASLYSNLGEYQKALEYHLKGLEICKSIYGESHPDTATSYNCLAVVHHSLREYQKALEYILKALEIQKSIYREFHPDTATSYNNIAFVYNSLGEYQKALEYFLKALKIYKSVYGDSHPDTASSSHNLAEVYQSLGEYQKALEYHMKVLEIRKSILGESHPDTATSYNNLAEVYESLGEYQKALEYHMKALKIRKSILGESHPDTATSYNNIAFVYNSLGEYQKALEYFLKALKIYKSVYGESHPNTASSYNNLASVYESLGEYQRALEYLLKALEIRKYIYGEYHPDTATSYNNLAEVYESLGEYQKALEYHLKALEIRKYIYGESHPDTATSYSNLASVYDSLGEYQRALEYFLKALEIWKLIYEESHPDTATSYSNLASVYESLGEYQKALEYHLKALKIRKPIYGESHPTTATSYCNLASVYFRLGEYRKALEYHLKALEILKSIYGESHPNTATSYNNLASVYESLGEYQKALEYHLKALEICKSIYGESHPTTATIYINLAFVYYSLGEYQKALEYYHGALEIKKLQLNLPNEDLALKDSQKELSFVSRRNSSENNQLSVPPTFIEVEEFPCSENRKDFETRSLSKKIVSFKTL